MKPATEIFYLLALQDWAPEDVTPFQGFAPGLPNFIPHMEAITSMPTDIIDPTLDLDHRLSRRRCGQGEWIWSPVNISTLLTRRKPLPEAPYFVVLTATKKTAKIVAEWRKKLRLQPIHLSYGAIGGAHDPRNFTRAIMKIHLLKALRAVRAINPRLDIEEHELILSKWREEESRPTSLKLHSHNVTRPNEMALVGSGEDGASDRSGHLNVAKHNQYVKGITDSCQAVMDLWVRTRGAAIFRALPPRPDVFVLGPSIIRGVAKQMERAITDVKIKAALRKLDRQKIYTIDLNLDKKDLNKVAGILSMRGAELKLMTTAVGLRTAGTLAATLRLPPAVDRTAGVVGQLARFMRAHENPPPVKTARVFKIVQNALINAIPSEHIDLIRKSESGIKIISDAPLEWLPIDGIPLGIRYDVSRVNTTPGNVFIEQIRPVHPVHLTPDTFRDYLVLSMFDDGDPIASHLKIGAALAMDGNNEHIVGRFEAPKTPDAFMSALRRFKGPMLIVDSHASHPDGDNRGGILIGDHNFDVWSLDPSVRVPPIVVLSACDTHPFDRSHATVANGFLARGAVAVVATCLPIRAPQAARIVLRLINRAVHFGSIANSLGYSVPWTHVVGGVLRTELVTDVIRGFQGQGAFDHAAGSKILLATNFDLNPVRPDWYDRLRKRIMEAGGLDVGSWEERVSDMIAGSDAIRYLHVGNPEVILVTGPDVLRKLEQGAPGKADLRSKEPGGAALK